MFLVELFNIIPFNFLYQAFLNILLLFYGGLGYIVEKPQMGIVIIVIAVIVRVLLAPISVRHYLTQSVWKKESSEPMTLEAILFGVQFFIAMMLHRLYSFERGFIDLSQKYEWVPYTQERVSQTLGSIDLVEPNTQLLVFSILLLFVHTSLRIMFAKNDPEAKDWVSVFLLPLLLWWVINDVSAGVVLFILISLVISVLLTLSLEGWEVARLSKEG